MSFVERLLSDSAFYQEQHKFLSDAFYKGWLDYMNKTETSDTVRGIVRSIGDKAATNYLQTLTSPLKDVEPV